MSSLTTRFLAASGALLLALLSGCTSSDDPQAPPTEPLPGNLSYNVPAAGYPLGLVITPLVPVVTGNVDSYSVSAGELPAGLTLDSATGVISGRTLVAGQFDSVITATNSAGSTAANLDIPVTLPEATRYVYTADAGDDSVSTWLVDSHTQRFVADGFVPAGSGPTDVALAIEGTHLASANTGSDDITVWAVNTVTGSLTEVGGSPFSAPSEPVSVAFHPALDVLYAGLRNGAGTDSIQAFSFNPTSGALQALGAPVPAAADLGRVRVDPAGRFVFASATASNGTVQSWLVGGTGELTAVGSVPAGAGANELATHPSGNFLYCVNTLADTVSAYVVAPDTGQLASVSAPAPVPGTGAAGATVSADGSVLFASSASGTVSGFTILATGELISLPAASLAVPQGGGPAVAAPSGLALYVVSGSSREVTPIGVEQDGSLSISSPGSLRARSNPSGITALAGRANARATATALYVANRGSNDLNQFGFGPFGVLRPLVPPNVLTGTEPVWVEVHPRTQRLYAANATATADAATAYALALDGSATQFQMVAGNAGSVAVQIEPSGRTAYLVNDKDDTVQAYSIDAQGELAPTGAALPLPAQPSAGAITPDGKYYYVPSDQGEAISQFAIGADGALTPLTPPVVSAPSSPVAVSVDPTGHFLYSSHSTGGNNLRGFSIATDGTLTELLGSPYALTGTAMDPADLEVHPEGTHVFTITRRDSGSRTVRTLQWFKIRETGDLQPIGTQALEGTPSRFAINPSGSVLYISIEDRNTIQLWRILPGLGGVAPSGSAAAGVEPQGIGLRTRNL